MEKWRFIPTNSAKLPDREEVSDKGVRLGFCVEPRKDSFLSRLTSFCSRAKELDGETGNH